MLNKQMLNDYVNQINEQTEVIASLKEQNSQLRESLGDLTLKIPTLKSSSAEGTSSRSQSKQETAFSKPTDSPAFEKAADYSFEHRQGDLLEEIERLKSELQRIAPLLDDEPERTHIRKSDYHSKEIMRLLNDDENDSEDSKNKLQQLLDNSKMYNQRIVFSDKNNQLWEISMVNDLSIDEQPFSTEDNEI
uniref:Uncharacterized protein n=1 Tax=Euplotes harpa TaxID=151035 RepID=A0A7S3JD38_9SPIT|mmetsp:Transcript_3375/g.4150  ORF Transcript_3375/g.4150 Transcript_3375/m.4150 type:complete len:191 (+) Transcript_3375:271-843(+)